MLKLTRTFTHGAVLTIALPLACAALADRATAAPITLDVTVNEEFNSANGQHSITPQTFQLRVTPPDPTTANPDEAPLTVSGVTNASTEFGSATFSATPFTAGFLAQNNLGALLDEGHTSIEFAEFDANHGTSLLSGSLAKGSTAGSASTGKEFFYTLSVGGVVTGQLHSAADVVQPTLQSLIDTLDNASNISFFEAFSIDTFPNDPNVPVPQTFDEFIGSATIDTAAAVPEPASIALFGAALIGFGWLYRRRESLTSR